LGGGTSASTGEPFAFVGRQNYYRDPETDLYFLGAGGSDSGLGRYYDPSAARFLSKDPIEQAGGHDNLYLYCANDPVNQTDPSGNRFLVRKCDWRNNGPYPESHAGRTLRDGLWRTYAENNAAIRKSYWGGRTDINLLIGRVEPVNGHEYGVLNLFDNLPAAVWGEAEKDKGPNGDAIRDALRRDWVITGPGAGTDGFAQGSAGALGLFWADVDPWLYTPPRYGPLDVSAPLASLALRSAPGRRAVTAAANSVPGARFVINTLTDAADAAGGAFEQGQKILLEKAEQLVRVGVAALLSQLGIKPEDLFDNIKHFADNITDALPGIIRDHNQFREALLGGLEDSLNDFQKGFPGNVIKLTSEWLVEKLGIEDADVPKAFPAKLDAVDIVFFLLNWLGLSPEKFKKEAGEDWSEIEATVQTLVGGQVETVLTDVQKLKDLFNKVWGGENSEDNPFSEAGKAKLFNELFEKLKEVLIRYAVTEGIKYVAGLVTPVGGLLKVVDFLIKVVNVGPAFLKDVSELLKKIGDGIAWAAKGNREEVKKVLDAAIPKLAKTALTFLSGIIGFDSVISQIKKPADTVKTKVTDVRQKLIGRLRGDKSIKIYPGALVEPYLFTVGQSKHLVAIESVTDGGRQSAEIFIGSFITTAARKLADLEVLSKATNTPGAGNLIPPLQKLASEVQEKANKHLQLITRAGTAIGPRDLELLGLKGQLIKDKGKDRLLAAGDRITEQVIDENKKKILRPAQILLGLRFQALYTALGQGRDPASKPEQPVYIQKPIDAEAATILNRACRDGAAKGRFPDTISQAKKPNPVNASRVVEHCDMISMNQTRTESVTFTARKKADGEPEGNTNTYIYLNYVAGREDDVAGHLFPQFLGGKLKMARRYWLSPNDNGVPLALKANTSNFEQAQSLIRAFLGWISTPPKSISKHQKPKVAELAGAAFSAHPATYDIAAHIMFDYREQSEPLRPSHITYEVYIDGIVFRYFFPNQ
jgi:RHS repeat-associated protein